MASTLARFESYGILPMRIRKPLVYATPVDNREEQLHRIVNTSQTIGNYPGIFEGMRRSMMRRVEACTNPMEDILNTYYKYNI
jgi:hypothetical protein